jgi:broad specificity phosphatase PhoE
MSRIVLVRHAQASFLEPHYDKLCANGEMQARLLGKFWASRGVKFGRVWSGSVDRHQQTGIIIAGVYRELGCEFPELVTMPEFNEYSAEGVLKKGLPLLLTQSQEARDLQQAFETSTGGTERRRKFQKLFEFVIGKWVHGELEIAGVESWQEFCARVHLGLEQATNGSCDEGDIVIFTSGGPIGVAMQRALHLSHSDTMSLTWKSRNASFSEFSCTGGRFSLSAFNSHPHLDAEHLLTYW